MTLLTYIVKEKKINKMQIDTSTPSDEKNESDSTPSENENLQNNDSKKHSKYNSGRWTQEEHKKFIDGILEYGNEWKKVQSLIKTRSSTQARSHAQKFFLRIKKNLNITDTQNISNDNNYNSSPSSSSQDNFSIKYFFELLASQDKEKSKFDNGKLTASQREKLLNIVAKFSNSEYDNIKATKQNDITVEINEEVNSLTNQMTKLPGRIFDIKKDSSRRESINSMYNIESNTVVANRKKNHRLSYDITYHNKKRPTPTNDFASTQNSSINQKNDNKIYQEMKELFGKKRKSEIKLDDFNFFDFSRPRFNSTSYEYGYDSQKLFDNPDFFPHSHSDNHNNMNISNNPFSINFEIDNDTIEHNPYENNEIHTDFNLNSIDYDKFNII